MTDDGEKEVVITMEGGVIQHIDVPPGVRVRVVDVDDDTDHFWRQAQTTGDSG